MAMVAKDNAARFKRAQARVNKARNVYANASKNQKNILIKKKQNAARVPNEGAFRNFIGRIEKNISITNNNIQKKRTNIQNSKILNPEQIKKLLSRINAIIAKRTYTSPNNAFENNNNT
jgi:hypothetical protein